MKSTYSSVKLASREKCITEPGLLYDADVSPFSGLCR